MRRTILLLLAAVAAVVALTGCGSRQPQPRPRGRVWVVRQHKRTFTACASSDCGVYSTVLNFSLPPYPGQTGYWVFVNGTHGVCSGTNGCVDQATSSPYLLKGMDCGQTYAIGVEAHDASSNYGPLYTTSYTAPTCPTGFAFADEFNGSSLDMTQWAPLDTPGENDQNEVQCYFPSQLSETAGAATMTTTFHSSAVACDHPGSGAPGSGPGTGNATANYTSGAMNWRTSTFTFGTVTVRAQMPSENGGAWPAIWEEGDLCRDATLQTYLIAGTANPNNACGSSVDTTAGTEEIDTVDGCCAGGSALQAYENNIFPTETSNTSGFPCTHTGVSNMETNWHVYSMSWSSTQVTWSLDGVMNCSVVNPGGSCAGLTNCQQLSSGHTIPTTPQFLIFNTAVGGCCGGTPVSGDYPQVYNLDYVHVTSAGAAQNTALPALSGTATHGNALSCTTGSWTNSPTSYTYQWFQDDTTPISGAATSSYTLQSADIGHKVGCVVTEHNTNGEMAQASALSATVN